MKHPLLIRPCLLLVAYVLSAGCLPGASVDASAADTGKGVEFAVGEHRAIPPDFFGVHHFLLGELGRVKVFHSPEVKRLLQDLKVQLLSGPDGSKANYYLFKEGMLITPSDPRFKTYYGTEARGPEDRRLREGYPPFLLADAFRMPNELGLPYIFVLNVTSQTTDDIVEEVTQMRKLTASLLRIEMGNEVYNRAGMVVFPSSHEYVKKCGEIFHAVKQLDPRIKLGIVAVGKDLEDEMVPREQQYPAAADAAGVNRAQRVGQWNRALVEHPDVYDAVITHSYLHIEKFTNATADSFMRLLYAFNQNAYTNIFRQAAQFPGKEIWLSAWGTLVPFLDSVKDEREKARRQFRKSPGFAIHVLEHQLLILESGKARHSSFHTLVDSQGNGIVQSKRPMDASELVKLPNFYTFQAFGQLLHDHPCFYKLQVRQGRSHPEQVPFVAGNLTVEVPEVGAWGFGDTQQLKQVVLANRTAGEIEVRLTGLSLKPVWSYGGPDPIPDFMANPNLSWVDAPRTNPPPEMPTADWSPTLRLKPFSMTIAKVQTP